MATFFELIFPEINPDSEETQVCCPFPHLTANNEIYYETNPSAGVNLEKRVFHCFSCGQGLTENQFIAKYMGIDEVSAAALRVTLDTDKNYEYWDACLGFENERAKDYVINELGISEKVINELKLKLGGTSGYQIEFPLFLFGQLVDVSNYESGRHPKTIRWKQSLSGLIAPYDIWKDDKRPTIICAGEKDMAIARSKGFNAITISGGEGTLPKYFGNDFTDREIYIVYDNDQTGKKGAVKVAKYLLKFTDRVKVIDISNICMEKGEDLWDFFMKYNKTAKDLVTIVKNTPYFTLEAIQDEYKTLESLIESTKAEYFEKIVKCNVQVVATLEAQYALPTSITAIKTKNDGTEQQNTMVAGETRNWTLEESNLRDILYLMDNKLSERKINENIKTILLKIPMSESSVSIKISAQTTVYKCTVTDYFETTDDDIKVSEHEAYCIGLQLDSGKKYKIKYTLVPHPYQGGKLTMVIIGAESAEDTVDQFKITPNKIELLKQFQVEDTLENKMEELIERCKGIVNANYNETLLKTIDLWYNTPLMFKVGKMEPVRAALDAIVVAESRVGKSTTADALKKLYGLGAVVSFAGSAATEAGLIGGSKLVNGNYQTKAGIIPQMHKNAIIFEEIGKANADILKSLTDIRSSGAVRIARVSGFFELPARVRMLSLTNTKAGKQPRPISSYPNGIEILTDLIGTPEDIARYDIMCIIGDKGTKEIDPFYEPKEPFSKESYQTRIRWIWSRKPEDIIITKEIYSLVVKYANKLNKDFNSYIKVFGTEAWKKIMRVAIAIAGYVVSTDETFTKLIVNEDHVKYAVNYMISLYDNPTFRFREFVREEQSYTDIDDESIKILQELFVKHSTLLTHLEGNSETNKSNLIAISGLPNDEFNAIMNRLVSLKFIKFAGYDIHPTERFRRGMSKISKKTKLERIGEGSNVTYSMETKS